MNDSDPCHAANAAPGRSCPLHYRYAPSVFDAGPTLEARTVYVLGGLYGNTEALAAIDAMRREEAARTGPVTLFFNGDFNWFNADADGLRAINAAVLQHAAIQGNVEAELAAPDGEAGCGCAYPDHVDNTVVEASNRIMSRLQRQATALPGLRARLSALPRHATIRVGGHAIGIVHGDAGSLSGWRYAAENLHRGAPGGEVPGHIRNDFRQARVSAFCSSHTCLPVMRVFDVDGQVRVIANNGAAGMPNFRGTRFGVITRISANPEPPAHSLYGTSLGGIRFDALPVRYDHNAWMRRFLALWPEGSPAHRSYLGRLEDGPDFSVDQAAPRA